MSGAWREFSTMRGDEGATRPLVRRQGVEGGAAEALLAQVAAVPWGSLVHAYGPAGDVPGQLAAVVLGDDATREEAWWNLWGTIHHQGTVYEATVPAVPILAAVAAWPEHPDRAQAILMLREIAAAEGVYVWRQGDGGEPVTLEAEQDRLLPVLRAAIDDAASALLAGWRTEPAAVQRALLWLLTVLPDHRARHEDLVADVLPAEHRTGFATASGDGPESQDEADALFAFDDWVTAA